MAYDLGTVKGSVSIDIAQAVASYAALRRANAATNTALLESSRSLKTVGAGLAGIGAIALAGFAVAVKAAADFQNQMRYFQVVTGSSKKDMQDATKEAFKLATTSGYTAGEIAGAFVELGKAGIDARQIVQGVGDAIAQLGAAAQIPLKDASEIIVNTMKTFQLGAGEATKIADQLAGAANASTVDITDLAYSLRYVGGTAASLGIPLHDVLDALGQLGNAGIRGSTGGTALRKILLQLAPTTKQAVQELEKLGIIQTNGGVSASNYAKMQDKQKTAIDKLRKAQEKLIEVQRVQAAQAGGTGSGTSSSDKQAAAARRLQAAQQRLAAAQEHLSLVQQKYSSSGSLATTAAKQATMFNQLQSAQDRVANASLHLKDVQAKASATGTASAGSAAKQIRAAYQLKSAQEAVAAAAENARKVGVKLAPGVEKLSNLFLDAHGRAKPLAEIFQILQEHTKGLTQAQKVQAAELIFGNRAISSALILTRQGAKGFKDFGQQMDQTKAADVMRKRLDTLSGALKQFKGALSVALIQAGTPAQTPLKLLVQGLTAMVKAFSSLPGPVQTLISAFVLFFGALTGGIGVFILTVSFVGKAVKAYREFKTALIFVKEVQLLQRAMALLNITMLANPVILIVAAIVALIAVFVILIIKVKPVRDFFIMLGKAIVDAFWAVVHFFERVPRYFEDAWNAIKKGASAFVGWIKKNWVDILIVLLTGPLAPAILIWKHFHTQIIGFVSAIVRDVVKFFARLPGNLVKILGAGLSALGHFLAELPNLVSYWLGFVIGRVIRWQIDLVKEMAKGAYNAVTAVIHFFEELPGRLESILTTLVKDQIKGWVLIYHTLVHWASAAVSAVVNFFEKLPGRLWSLLVTLQKREVQGWKNIWSTITGWASKIFTDVVGFFEKLPTNLYKILLDIIKWMGDQAINFYNAAVTIGEDIVNGIVNFVTNLPSLIWKMITDSLKTITNLAKDAFNTAKGWGSSLWNGFKKGLFGSPRTKIEYAFENMTKTADKETKKLAQHVRRLNSLTAKMSNGSYMFNAQTAAMTSSLARSSGTSQDAGHAGNTYDIDIHNPAPEKASESVPRVLRNLEFVGAM